ncbi:uncharacterized protein [Montipora foliosa]|uniref:uncharacterized protein n=1 Tax=Montipora foliosa TaxID=591990 RepID=UPI0035F1FFBE
MAEGKAQLTLPAFDLEMLLLIHSEAETTPRRLTASLLKDVKIQPKYATQPLVSKPAWPYAFWRTNYEDLPLQAQSNLVQPATGFCEENTCETDSTTDSSSTAGPANGSPELKSSTTADNLLFDQLNLLSALVELIAGNADNGSPSTDSKSKESDPSKTGAILESSEKTLAEDKNRERASVDNSFGLNTGSNSWSSEMRISSIQREGNTADQVKAMSLDTVVPVVTECESKIEQSSTSVRVCRKHVCEDPVMPLEQTINLTPDQNTLGYNDPIKMKEEQKMESLDEAPKSGQMINASKSPHFTTELQTLVSTQSVLYNSLRNCYSIEATVHELQANYFIFSKSYIINTGSMADGTKIGDPDEFDFNVALPVLADPAIAELLYTKLGIQTQLHYHVNDKVLSFLHQFPFVNRSYRHILTNAYLLLVFRETLKKQLPIEWIMLTESDIHMMRVFLKAQILTLHLQCISGPYQDSVLSIDVCYGIPLNAKQLETVYVSDTTHALHLSFIQSECLRMNTEVLAVISQNPLVGRRFFFRTEPYRFQSHKLVADCYRLAKYLTRIFLPRISKNNCKLCEDTLIPSFHLKTAVSFMMDAYKEVSDWSDAQLGDRVIEVFEIIKYSYSTEYRTLAHYSYINSMRLDVKMKYIPNSGVLKVGEGLDDDKPCTIPKKENVSLASSSSQVNIATAVQRYWNYMETEEWTVGDLLSQLVQLLYVFKFTDISP